MTAVFEIFVDDLSILLDTELVSDDFEMLELIGPAGIQMFVQPDAERSHLLLTASLGNIPQSLTDGQMRVLAESNADLYRHTGNMIGVLSDANAAVISRRDPLKTVKAAAFVERTCSEFERTAVDWKAWIEGLPRGQTNIWTPPKRQGAQYFDVLTQEANDIKSQIRQFLTIDSTLRNATMDCDRSIHLQIDDAHDVTIAFTDRHVFLTGFPSTGSLAEMSHVLAANVWCLGAEGGCVWWDPIVESVAAGLRYPYAYFDITDFEHALASFARYVCANDKWTTEPTNGSCLIDPRMLV